MTPKFDLMFTPISVRIDCSVTDDNKSYLHVGFHIGTVESDEGAPTV